MKEITEHTAEKIFDNNEVPDDVKIKGLPIVLCAELDGRPQELRKLRPFLSYAEVPGHLPQAAQDFLQLLFSCFDRQGFVAEGLIGDILFGYEAVGVDPLHTLVGLGLLHKEGYVEFQAKDGSLVDMASDKIASASVRYKKKLLDLVYS